MKTLRFLPIGKVYGELVLVDKIVRLSKSEDGKVTFIHLIDGTILATSDSIRTINTRLNTDE